MLLSTGGVLAPWCRTRPLPSSATNFCFLWLRVCKAPARAGLFVQPGVVRLGIVGSPLVADLTSGRMSESVTGVTAVLWAKAITASPNRAVRSSRSYGRCWYPLPRICFSTFDLRHLCFFRHSPSCHPCAARTATIVRKIVFHVSRRIITALGNIQPSQQMCLIRRVSSPRSSRSQ